MVSYIQNTFGHIYAFIEWEIVNKDGQFEDNGEYCYIADIWIKPNLKNCKLIQQLSKKINEHPFSKNVKFIYWVTKKHNERMSKIFTKDYFVKKWRL